MSVTSLNAWLALKAHCQAMSTAHLRDLFAEDPQRVEKLSLSFDGLRYDFSKQRMSAETLRLLVDLAAEAQVPASVACMFAGEELNRSERRSVLHVALRRSHGPFPGPVFDVMPEVLETRRRMVVFAESVRSGACFGHHGMPIRDVVNIGIGGSDLGPKMMGHALRSLSHPALRVHYVSNLDGAQFAPLLQTLDPRTTLFIVVSKTFMTQETLCNANAARDWLRANLGEGFVIGNHFVAVTSNPERAMAFGVPRARVFPLWNWVGGRYSLWSAVGLILMIAIGPHAFEEMLNGAERMDEHFLSTPLERNLPVVMALVGLWNTNFLGASSLAVLPYSESLKHLPPFLQQLEMGSNGKSVDLDGNALDYATCPIIWGDLGNNAQHAFFQLLHQGGRLIPCDFVVSARSDFPLSGHQEALLANCFAQSAALAFGRSEAQAQEAMAAEGAAVEGKTSWLPQQIFPANQPSSTLVLGSLSPATLGSLVALYEHKVFVQGAIWGLNSFDQWGVELGKAEAGRLLPAIADERAQVAMDASTRGLIDFAQRYL